MQNLSDPFSLKGRTALVTGAAGHLGRAISHALACAGAHVLLNGRTAAGVEQLAAELRHAGLSAEAAAFDVTDGAAIIDFFAGGGMRPIHILVNNAYSSKVDSIWGSAGTIATSDVRHYAVSYAITVTAAHDLVRAALPNLRAGVRDRGGASVINVASMYGMVSPDVRIYDRDVETNPPYYGAAKAALIQWTRYAACEFGREGIRVNAISPGPFPAPAVQNANPAFIDRLSTKVPLGRVGASDELGGPIVFLASTASSYVNGANLVVDGGWTCW